MDRPIKKWASIYSNGRLLCIKTCSGIRRTASDPDGRVILLSADSAELEEIGKGLVEALSVSRVLSPDEVGSFFDVSTIEARYEKWVSLLLEKFDYRSRRELFKNMKLCNVECVNSVVFIRPTHHERIEAWSAKGIDASAYVMVSEDAPAHEIGEAVTLALARCTGM